MADSTKDGASFRIGIGTRGLLRRASVKGSRRSEVSSRRHKPGREIFEDGTGVVEAHVLGPVDRLYSFLVPVLRASAAREQPLHQLGIIADCGVEEAGPAGLHHPP